MGPGYLLGYVGIDRTVMMLTDHIRIQEVLLFPAMKPEDNTPEVKPEAKVEEKGEAKVESA